MLSITYISFIKSKGRQVYYFQYKILRLDRNKNGGGLAIFISEDLKFEIRHDVPLHNLELIILKILPYLGVPFNLMTWYRPPSANIDSFKQLEAVISFLDQEEHEKILVGDTNCDLSFKYETFDRNYNITNHIEHLDRIYDQYGFSQIIKEATRETTSTYSIIHHIATTNINNIHQSGVIKTCISDHYMVFCILKFRGAHNKQHKMQHKFISCRRMKHFDGQKFYDEAASLPWWYIVRKHDNMNSAVNYFTEILVSLIEKHATLRLKQVSQKHCPWLNADYHALSKARDRLKKAAIKQNSTYLMESYKHLRHKVKSLSKKLKREYLSNKLQENI